MLNTFGFNLTIAENGDISAVVVSSDPALSVGNSELLAAGPSYPWGGTTPADDITFTVATLTNLIMATTLDTSKSVNKLTDGDYVLFDGVEGQIMYLVRSPGTTPVNVRVLAIHGDGTSPLYPFRFRYNGVDVIDNTGICTLIFTDGNWKQTGGAWD